MKTSELIGKRIVNIKDKIEIYGNELLTSNGIIELESGEIIEVPNRDSETITLKNNNSLHYTSIFNEDRFFKRLFSKSKYQRKIASQNKKEIKGKLIVGIYQYDEPQDEDEWNELEKMIIEVESGYLISEIEISFFGVAGIIVFTSKEEMVNRYGDKLRTIYA